MSARVPINNFGSPLAGGLSKDNADHLYLNVAGGDMMRNDLDMAGNVISNLSSPSAETDACNKAYVDSEISELNSAINLLAKQAYVTSEINKLTGRLESSVQALAKQAYVTSEISKLQEQINAKQAYIDQTKVDLTQRITA